MMYSFTHEELENLLRHTADIANEMYTKGPDEIALKVLNNLEDYTIE